MNHLKIRIFFAATILFALFSFQGVHAQTHTPRYNTSMISNSGGYYEYLPEGYDPNGTTRHPLIIFIHGIYERGDGNTSDLPLIVKFGLPKYIKYGYFPKSFTVNGKTEKFIVISPQFRNSPSSADINGVITYVLNKYRVNSNKVYLTGLSMGGGATWNFGANPDYNKRITAMVPICGSASPYSSKAAAIAAAGIKVWATHNKYDDVVSSSKTVNWVNYVNAANPAVKAKASIWARSGHDAWTKTYQASYTEDGMNIYQWMLQYERGTTTTTPTNQVPVANAGLDKTISLPTSSVTLAGSGTDADGSITKYSWTKTAGPTGSVFSSTNVASPVVSSLVAGTYTFRLTVTDNSGATDYDDVTISVNALGNQVPVANAGSDKIITLPTSSVTFAGSGTDADGTITKYSWTKTSGPSSYTFSSTSVASPTVSNLVQGTYIFRLTVTDDDGATDYESIEVTVNAAPTTATTLKIEAEDYTDEYGVNEETTTDVGGGQNLGYIDEGDWMEYSVDVSAAGSYTMKLRLASGADGGQFVIKNAAGTILATVYPQNTGGYQTWQDVSASVKLAEGTQTIRLQSTARPRWNFNYFTIVIPTSGSSSSETPTTISKIEAESYTDEYGVSKETTTDAGGGQNVGYIDEGDWMEYSVNVSTAGTYAFKLRLASGADGGQFVIKNAAGTVLKTVDAPNTGGYQVWQDVSVNVNLVAGTQTLKIQSVARPRWNFNYFTVSTATALTTATTSTGSEAMSTEVVASNVTVSPNPFADKFLLKVNNSYTGAMKVQLIDEKGTVQKEYLLNKSAAGASQTYLSAGALPAGKYSIKVEIGDWSETQPVVKQ